MKTINLGQSGLGASQIALGVMRMGSLSSADATEVLETVHDAGVNFFDAADIYVDGRSEEVFGKALKNASFTRDDVYVQSKGGIVLDHSRSKGDLVFGQRYDFSKQHLLDAVDGSLQRLGVDYLDSFLLHRPDPLMEPEEIAEAFNELQASGKVRHFGVSNFNPSQIDMLQSHLNQKLLVDQLQFGVMHTGMVDSGMHVNMTDADSLDHDGGLLEYLRFHKMNVQAWSPYQYGMFEGVFIDNPKFPELNDKLQAVADKYSVTKNAIATAWITRMPQNIQVVLGSMNPNHLKESIAGADVQLEKQEWYDIYFAAGHVLP
ncbi:aldo/keto reductase [Paucilactobacillus wasatchensis]|uniref:Oxidoreductase, aldo/keto reductase family n=1 Tax=Paucilactobacillus wasatchensis TaxID=1335616 RepID=A0A0D1A8G6_9LACO|nr:aldo/keto reductase [Paucilactobacillus wasatchensis]KIS03992.1 Oxidoreductase, aldo/keto reductase family [Paucilactobacillus wasatchensis]